MAEQAYKNRDNATRLGEHAPMQPCSGIREVVSRVQGEGGSCALPGGQPVRQVA